MEKTRIMERMECGDLSAAKEMLIRYERTCPDDFELFSLKGTYYFMLGDYERARRLFMKGLSYIPYNYDLLYNLGLTCEMVGDRIEAVKNYRRATTVAASEIEGLEENQKFNAETEERVRNIFSKFQDIVDAGALEDKIFEFQRQFSSNFGFTSIYPWALNEPNYYGKCLRYYPQYYVGDYFRLGVLITTDFRKVEVVKTLSKADSKELKIDAPVLVPMLVEDAEELRLKSGGKEYVFSQFPKVFHWYRLEEDVSFLSDVTVGEPVPLQCDESKKKLILTIFVDGLSQPMLEKYGFEKWMPNTARFFSNAVYFTNCFSSGEWTYPSMASYFTGLYTPEHKMFSTVIGSLPENTKTLGEIFSDAGYLCGKVDGDWRTNPDMGYMRGFYRYIYGKYTRFSDAVDVMGEAEEHLQLFEGTNQYLMITFDELHDIADGYKQPPSVQRRLSLDTLEKSDAEVRSSVLTARDAKKEAKYMEQLGFLDQKLESLYHYLNQHYRDDEMIVSLISDHGQGYLLEDGDFFLDEKRTRVPMLLKGVVEERTVCDEYISAVDYLNIMNHVADLGADLSDKEGVLPKFFGGCETRDFVVSESLHPDRPYRIALRNEEDYFTFETEDVARTDGRVHMEEYTAKLRNAAGEEVHDEEKFKRCLAYVMEHMKYYRIY